MAYVCLIQSGSHTGSSGNMTLKWLKWFIAVSGSDGLFVWGESKLSYMWFFRLTVTVHLEYPRFEPLYSFFPRLIPNVWMASSQLSLRVSEQKQTYTTEITWRQRPWLWPVNSPCTITAATPTDHPHRC